MYFQAHGSTGLHADDVAGVTSLYPPGAALCTSAAQCPALSGMGADCTETGCQPVPPGGLGTICDTTTCAPGLDCLALGDGSYHCTHVCVGDADCGSGTYCVPVTGDDLCFPPGALPIGAPCSYQDECASVACLDVCVSRCLADDCECPLGTQCDVIEIDGGRAIQACLPGAGTCVRCGDGVVGGDEQCDTGAANSDYEPDACRASCRTARCGDGTRDSGEACDDGNTSSGDGCDATCQPDVASDAGARADSGAGPMRSPSSGSCTCTAAGLGLGAPLSFASIVPLALLALRCSWSRRRRRAPRG
jgi:cysteine-rich repeat protein